MKRALIYLGFVIVLCFCISRIVGQQHQIHAYSVEKKQYETQVNQEKERKNELTDTLENLNSTEYIENIAREKLDMYLPNERVYIDIDK